MPKADKTTSSQRHHPFDQDAFFMGNPPRLECKIEGCSASFSRPTDLSRHKWAHMPRYALPTCPFVYPDGRGCIFKYQGRNSCVKTHWEHAHRGHQWPEDHTWPKLKDICEQLGIVLSPTSRMSSSGVPSTFGQFEQLLNPQCLPMFRPLGSHFNYPQHLLNPYPPLGMSVQPNWTSPNPQIINNALAQLIAMGQTSPVLLPGNPNFQQTFPTISPNEQTWEDTTPLVVPSSQPTNDEVASLFGEPFMRQTSNFF
ncbi:hypothetical protein CPB86DRAFT_787853 [Serendipita vermifera]|nr:hypothetical protein CPB86DRAFT_787853 [Serendipita vermifera]